MAMRWPMFRCLSPRFKPSQVLLPDIAGRFTWSRHPAPQLDCGAGSRLCRAAATVNSATPRRWWYVKDGRVVAERYAEGYGVDTRILGFSSTKSVTSALIGVLGAEGGADARRRPRRSRHGAARGDPRERNHGRSSPASHRGAGARQFASGFARFGLRAGQPDEVHGIGYGGVCREHRTRHAARQLFNYNDGNNIILSHLIRNATRGRPADVMRFAREELFAPLGMRNVTIEFDASGTPEGSSQMLASARDWARFGCSISVTAWSAASASCRRDG